MNFPGHKYLGPGNALNRGSPVDEDDRIVEEHDREYARATHPEHIRAADVRAIGNFGYDFVNTGNWHSAIGALGLSAKYLGESIIGVLYPRKMAEKRGADDSMESEASADKRSKRDLDTAKVKPGLSGSANSTSAVSPPNDLEYNSGKFTFVHKRLISTRGVTFKCKQSRVPGSAATPPLTQYMVTTPFCQIPVHFLPWYLTEAEFYQLPIGASITKVRNILKPLGYRAPFLAGSASLSYCNADNIIFGINAFGLNNKYHGWNFNYSFDITSPMVVSGIQQNDFQAYELWGEYAKDKEMTYIPPTVGNVLDMDKYYTLTYEGITTSEEFYGLPELMQNLNIFQLSNSTANEDVVYEYRPMKNILKTGKIYPPFRNKQVQFNIGSKITGKYEGQSAYNRGSLGELFIGSKKQKTYVGSYGVQIEQSGCVSNGLFEEGGGFAQPTLLVGVLPVHAFSNSSTDDTYQPIYSYWSEITECEIEFKYGLTNPYADFVHPSMHVYGNADYVANSNLDVAYEHS